MPSGVYIRTEFHKKKIREGMNGGNSTSFKKGDGLNENNVLWKGDDAKPSAKHYWVYRKFGRPETCEICGKTGLRGTKIQWSNKDHKYSRNREDWQRICPSCHSYYDRKYNNYQCNQDLS